MPPTPGTAASETSARRPEKGLTIQDISAWVLRIGVVVSVTVMLVGIAFSFVHGTTPVSRMQSATFDYRPRAILKGVLAGSGKAIIEVGIYLLVLTPIMRVFMSALMFAFHEKDWLYAAITFLVLVLTVAGLVFLS